jgi:hypothetical protein
MPTRTAGIGAARVGLGFLALDTISMINASAQPKEAWATPGQHQMLAASERTVVLGVQHGRVG